MDVLSDKLNAIVITMRTGKLNDRDTNELCSLINENETKLQVNGVSLFTYYLETSHSLRIEVIRTFVNDGYDVNGQDNCGRTPLHWLVGHEFELPPESEVDEWEASVVTLIELILSKGANPCLLDNDGNNVLMLAIITEQPEAVIEALLSRHGVNKQLIDQKNKMGFTALALYFRSIYIPGCLKVGRLLKLHPDPTATDNYGNNYLHNLFLRPVEQYQRTVDYNAWNSSVLNVNLAPWLAEFRGALYALTSTMRVDITQKNKDGLIPLQVVLKDGPLDRQYHFHAADQRDLECLVPDDEQVLTQLVPKDQLNDPFSLTSKVWFVARITKYGLDFTEDNVLATCLSTNFSNHFIIGHLIEKGVVPRMSDIMLAIKWKRWIQLSMLSDRVLEDDVRNIDDNSHEILVKTLLTNGEFKPSSKVSLLRKGLPLRAHDFKNIAEDLDCASLDIFDYFTPELVVELNAQSPNLLEDIILTSRGSAIEQIIRKLVNIGLEVTGDCFKNAFTTGCPLAIIALIEFADDRVKGDLKQTLPNAHQDLLKMYHNSTAIVEHWNMNLFDGCIRFVVDCGIAVTLDDLERALDLNEPFILHHFIRHLNFSYIKQVKVLFPNILVRVLSQCAQKDRIAYGQWLVNLVKYLSDWFEIDIKYVDSTYGSMLSNIITLFAMWPKYSSDVFVPILQMVLKQNDLDIDTVQIIQNDSNEHKKTRIEMSPLQYALDYELVEAVNCLVAAGANCHGFDVIDQIKGHKGATTTFCIMYTIGYPVELSQLYVANASNAYMLELAQLSIWLKVESKRTKTLKELTAMRVERDLTRFEFNAFMKTFELRPEIKEMFQLKHMVKLEPLPDVSDVVKVDSNSFE